MGTDRKAKTPKGRPVTQTGGRERTIEIEIRRFRDVFDPQRPVLGGNRQKIEKPRFGNDRYPSSPTPGYPATEKLPGKFFPVEGGEELIANQSSNKRPFFFVGPRAPWGGVPHDCAAGPRARIIKPSTSLKSESGPRYFESGALHGNQKGPLFKKNLIKGHVGAGDLGRDRRACRSMAIGSPF